MVVHTQLFEPVAFVTDIHVFKHLFEFFPVFRDILQINLVGDVDLSGHRKRISAQNEHSVISLFDLMYRDFLEVLDTFKEFMDLLLGFLVIVEHVDAEVGAIFIEEIVCYFL